MAINLQIPGQLSKREMQAIEAVAALVPEKGNIVEVGSLLGLSSWIWAKSAHPSVTVYCVDPWEKQGAGGNFGALANKHNQQFTKEQFLKNTHDCPNVVACQGYSPQDFIEWKVPLDLYFEDAVHTDPIFTKNVEFWRGHIKLDGILCGHDYVERFADVVNGVKRLSAELGRSLTLVDSFWALLPGSLLNHREARVTSALSTLIGLTRAA